MFSADEIKRLIATQINCQHIAIEGDDGVHFTGMVVSDDFTGLASVRRHQRVYACLGRLMGNEIHALQLRTLTPVEWQAQT